MELSREQQIAFDKYVEGKNIFITGPGGTGKSELIRKMYQHALRNSRKIQVCALTGCAAVLLNANAKTIHSWSGIGLGNGTLDKLITKIKSNKYSKKMWKETEILIVDEVSMLSLKLFDILNQIGKSVRGNNRAFGGIQIIMSGDFYQLPPVGNTDEVDTMRFCFESDEWNSVFNRNCQIQLIKIFRQNEECYASLLNQVREGKIKRKSYELLKSYVGRKMEKDMVITKLYPTKGKVDALNNCQMNALTSEERVYELKYKREPDAKVKSLFGENEIEYELEYLSNNLICDKSIKLKIGCQVMCVVNMQSDASNGVLEVCNGSQGIVTGYCQMTSCPIVKFNNGLEKVMTRHFWQSEKIEGIGVLQVPLILAWALTIHKSQGASLDAAEIDVGVGVFECGQTYVALSRVRNLDGLYLTSFDITKIKINKKVKDYYDGLNLYQEKEEVFIPVIVNIDSEKIQFS